MIKPIIYVPSLCAFIFKINCERCDINFYANCPDASDIIEDGRLVLRPRASTAHIGVEFLPEVAYGSLFVSDSTKKNY